MQKTTEPTSPNARPQWTIASTESGSARPPRVSTVRKARGPGARSANQTPGAPTPSIAIDTDRNAQWYQSTTLRIRVAAIWKNSTASETRAIAKRWLGPPPGMRAGVIF